MPSATSLAGTELIPIVQNGANKTTTPAKIKEGLATVAQLGNKVDKDGNKVLSEQDFTTKLKSKLDGIEAEANKYEHPANHPASIITQDATHRFVTDAEKATWNGKANTEDIPDVSGFATAVQLDTKVDKDGSKVLSEQNFTTVLKTKLDGIAVNANNYVHPTGNGNNHIPQGGAEGQFLGYSAAGTAKWVNAPTTSISAATSTALGGIKIGYTQSAKNYPIVLDSDGKAYVVVPWTDTVYTHPTTAGNKHIPAEGSAGQILKWSADGTAIWGDEKTYSEATASVAGLMSAVDKAKLDGVAAQANKYEHPTTHPASIIVQDASHKFVSDAEKNTWNNKSDNIVVELVSTSTQELQPNKYYVFGEVETLTLTLASGSDTILNEYMFEFTSGATPTVLTEITGVEWKGDTIEANKLYQASISRGIGILIGRAKV